jgi:hypothetical protein
VTVLSGGYAAWAAWLDAFARGDDRPMDDLVPVDESLGPAMFGRLLQRISAAYTTRAGLWSRTLDQRMAVATGVGGMHDLAAALVNGRSSLRPLWRLADSPLLPEQVRAELRRALTDMLAEMQRSLEDSARRWPGGEEVLAVLREHRLTVVAPPAPVPSPSPAPPVGRRVIL